MYGEGSGRNFLSGGTTSERHENLIPNIGSLNSDKIDNPVKGDYIHNPSTSQDEYFNGTFWEKSPTFKKNFLVSSVTLLAGTTKVVVEMEEAQFNRGIVQAIAQSPRLACIGFDTHKFVISINEPYAKDVEISYIVWHELAD